MNSSHQALFKQLEKMTCGELQSSRRLIELLKEKLNLLNVDDFEQDRASEIATVFIDLLKDTLGALSSSLDQSVRPRRCRLGLLSRSERCRA